MRKIIAALAAAAAFIVAAYAAEVEGKVASADLNTIDAASRDVPAVGKI